MWAALREWDPGRIGSVPPAAAPHLGGVLDLLRRAGERDGDRRRGDRERERGTGDRSAGVGDRAFGDAERPLHRARKQFRVCYRLPLCAATCRALGWCIHSCKDADTGGRLGRLHVESRAYLLSDRRSGEAFLPFGGGDADMPAAAAICTQSRRSPTALPLSASCDARR